MNRYCYFALSSSRFAICYFFGAKLNEFQGVWGKIHESNDTHTHTLNLRGGDIHTKSGRYTLN